MSYPKIREAARWIAYDSGMINRFFSEERVVTIMMQAAVNKFNGDQLDCAELELAALTEEQFADFCTGEYDATRLRSIACIVLDWMFETGYDDGPH